MSLLEAADCLCDKCQHFVLFKDYDGDEIQPGCVHPQKDGSMYVHCEEFEMRKGESS